MPTGYERKLFDFLFEYLSSVLGASSRLLVSNLDFGVDDRDMRELFASFGSLAWDSYFL